MTRAWRRWVALLSRVEPGTGLALFRVALGLCVVGIVLEAWTSGVAEVIWVDVAQGGYRHLTPTWLFALFGGATRAVLRGVLMVALAAGVGLVLGLGGRLAALLALVPMVHLTRLNPEASGAYDLLLTNGLWLLVLADASRTWSLDAKLRTGAWVDPTPVPAWPRGLALFQLIGLTYFMSGVQKVSTHWPLGGGLSGLYFTLQQPTWQRFDMGWLAQLYPLTQVGTLVSWLFEVLAPLWLVAIWRRWRVRHLFTFVGVTMHVLILVLMDVGPFSFVSLAYYACLVRPGAVSESHATAPSPRAPSRAG